MLACGHQGRQRTIFKLCPIPPGRYWTGRHKSRRSICSWSRRYPFKLLYGLAVAQHLPIRIVANAWLLPFMFEMRGPLSEDQRWPGAHCRIRDTGAVCGRAESDTLLHDALSYEARQHLRIRFGVPQLCGSVTRDPAARLAWRPARRLVVAAIPALGF